MALKNYTTDVPVMRSLQEIQAILGKAGARSMSVDYDDKGAPVAVSFVLMLDGFPQSYRLPRDSNGALRALRAEKSKDMRPSYRTEAHAERVSWRILKDWLDAQLALVQCTQAESAQAFMPYATQDGRTLFEVYREQRQKQLGSGS
jgi:hypothetical protein